MDEIKPFMEALLGLMDPWALTRIGADLEAGQVDLYVDFLPGRKSAILRWFSTRLSNGLLEGLNSLFQAARAKARGYRSLKYGILAFYLVGGRFEFQLPGFYAVTHTK